VSEKDFLAAMDNICRRLVYKFRFGYHDVEDMRQQASVFALEGLNKYDHKRPLENFLWTHVRNRLFNFKRNNYKRPDSPCITCPLYDPQLKKSTNACSKYLNKESCELYRPWLDRNNNKKNIMTPISIEYDVQTRDTSDSVAENEVLKYIESHINGEYRELYLRLKNGDRLIKNKLESLQVHIKQLMEAFHKHRR